MDLAFCNPGSSTRMGRLDGGKLMANFEPEVSVALRLPVKPWGEASLLTDNPNNTLLEFRKLMIEKERLVCRMLVAFLALPEGFTFADATLISSKDNEVLGIASRDECLTSNKTRIRIFAKDHK
jgi:hypothetical protein